MKTLRPVAAFLAVPCLLTACMAEPQEEPVAESSDAIACIGGVRTDALGDLRCHDGFRFGEGRELCAEVSGCDKRVGRVLFANDSPFCGWGGTAFTLRVYSPNRLARPTIEDESGVPRDMLFAEPAPSQNWELCTASKTQFGVAETALGGQSLYRHDFDCFISGNPNFLPGVAGAVELGAIGAGVFAAGWVVLTGVGTGQILFLASKGVYASQQGLLGATLLYGAKVGLTRAGIAAAGAAATGITAGLLASTSSSDPAPLCDTLAGAR